MSSVLTQNHFELFSIPVEYTLDYAELDARYRKLQQTVHPDRYVNASDQERRIAMQQAAQINEAYTVLKDVTRRGQYVLELAGVDLQAEQRTTQDPAFLMQQMELREELSEVKQQADPLQSLDGLLQQARQQKKLLELALTEFLQDKDYLQASETVLKMQFYNRLLGEMQEVEAELEDANL